MNEKEEWVVIKYDVIDHWLNTDESFKDETRVCGYKSSEIWNHKDVSVPMN